MAYNKEQRRKYLAINKEKIQQKKKAYYEKNKEHQLKTQKKWEKANRVKIREYQKRKRSTDPIYKLKANIKNLIGNAMRNNNFKKLSHTEQILGCSYQEFKTYLESKFESWMTWENRGLCNNTINHGWDIDHIIPLSTATCEADILSLSHFTNLQPLCSYTNRHIKRGLNP